MEWRHTLEILTKDIQDIEKLVGNLQNSAASPSIDLDLAMSKLRNVYEVLSMIREDQMEEKRSMYAAAKVQAVPESAPPAEKKATETPHEQEVAEEHEHLQDAPATEENAGSPIVSTKEEPAASPIASTHEEPAASPVTSTHEEPSSPDASATGKDGDPLDKTPSTTARTQAEDAPDKAGVPGQEQPSVPGKGILAEKFSAESSINDNLAGKRPAGTEARLAGKPIDNIHRNIGINDRFLIIRELFKGDADSFRDLITELDEAGNLQKAETLLHQRFPDTAEHEGIEILEGLIKRRFTTV